MGILKSAGDLVYTFRFLRLLTVPFKETEAFKHGIIDETGKIRKTFDKSNPKSREAYKEYYTPFHRLVYNIKKIIEKVPGGSSTLATYAAALFLLKEKFNISERNLEKIILESGFSVEDLLEEDTKWFLTDEGILCSGIYKLKNDKMLNINLEETARKGDKIKVLPESYPVGSVAGINIYEAIHINSNQKVYIAPGEILR